MFNTPIDAVGQRRSLFGESGQSNRVILECSGSEANVTQCSYSSGGIAFRRCKSGNRDASVICESTLPTLLRTHIHIH